MDENTTYVCRNCGSDRIRTVETISGACGIADIYPADPPGTYSHDGRSAGLDYDFDGLGTEVFWDSSETTGFDCGDCMFTTETLEDLVGPKETYISDQERAALLDNIA